MQTSFRGSLLTSHAGVHQEAVSPSLDFDVILLDQVTQGRSLSCLTLFLLKVLPTHQQLTS